MVVDLRQMNFMKGLVNPSAVRQENPEFRKNPKYEESLFPKLLGPRDRFTFTAEDFANEMDAVVSRANQSNKGEVYVYSVSTQEPLNVARVIDLKKLEQCFENHKKSAINGNFYIDNMREANESLYSAFLALASVSSLIEISLRSSANRPVERKVVQIKASIPEFA